MANTYKLINVNGSSSIGSGPSAGSGEAVSFDVSQEAHGFVELNPVYFDGANWSLAKADDEATLATHLVTDITSSSVFTITQSGKVQVSGHGLAIGGIYYASETTAGDVTTVEGTTFSNPKFQVLDADNIIVLDYRPSYIDNASFPQKTTALLSNQTSTIIPDLIFDSTLIVSIDMEIVIEVQSSITAKEAFEVKAVFDGSWDIEVESTGGNTQVSFEINSTTGQVAYNSPNYTSFVDGKISYKYDIMSRSL